MKKIISTLLVAAPTLLMAQQQLPFTITGKAPTIKAPAKVFLTYKSGSDTVTDSVNIVKGKFNFKGNVTDATQAVLSIDHTGNTVGRKTDSKVIYLAKEKITVAVKDSVKNAIVTGSAINKEYALYQKALEASQNAIADINKEYAAAPEDKKKDAAFTKGLQDRYAKIMEDQKVSLSDFISNNPNSIFSLDALRTIAGSKIDLKLIEPLFNHLSAAVKATKKGEAFAKRIESAKIIQIGKVAPDFTQNDVNDKPVKLSDFRGKYVLIDFWASWCGPCRAENPNVVEAFNKFKDKNFTILGVSLDRPDAKDKWLAAIEKDNLTWTQVSDLKFWENEVARQYGINAIPQNYLIDPNGVIVAENLRGEKLQEKLAEILK
ncbi:MAG: AhpC/TSA family protein [Chitinophagaceae bacterium]|nr:MAG: AhpC/TSA family protein [Chitinophagaceae bacterium]